MMTNLSVINPVCLLALPASALWESEGFQNETPHVNSWLVVVPRGNAWSVKNSRVAVYLATLIGSHSP